MVNKSAGTVTLYVNGAFAGSTTFTPNTAAREYGATPFRIGRAQTNWAGDGKVDQVRIYNVALTSGQVSDLFNETATPTLRFPVGMSKGQQLDLLGMPYTPDGHMTGGTVTSLTRTLDSARFHHARITLRATGGNANFETGSRHFDLAKWKAAFDNVSGLNANSYVADSNGTLIGHYAIDEPFSDFDNMTSAFLEQMCQYQKSFTGWNQVPCIVRELNTRLYTNRPAGGTYQYVDMGYATIVDHTYLPAPYNGNMQAFLQDNVDKGAAAGLSTMYSFNILNGGREVAGCAKPEGSASHNCAMSPAEVREVAAAIAGVGDDKGCGVLGWEIDDANSASRTYFFSAPIQGALHDLNTTVGGLRPGSCGP